jgi:hypothetical protein
MQESVPGARPGEWWANMEKVFDLSHPPATTAHCMRRPHSWGNRTLGVRSRPSVLIVDRTLAGTGERDVKKQRERISSGGSADVLCSDPRDN